MAEGAWNAVTGAQPDPRPAVAQQVDQLQRLQVECIVAAVQPGRHYSVAAPEAEPRARNREPS
eukprot:9119190-Pyramimonas_sp.AAC.1